MNGTALVTERAAELWLPTQDQSTARKLVAKFCDLPGSASPFTRCSPAADSVAASNPTSR
jgi:hypothetical protein